MKLYELTKNWNRIREELDRLDDPDEVASFEETLDALATDIYDKAENIAVLIKELAAEAAALRAEEDAIYKRRRTAENRVESLERYLMGQMAVAGISQVVGSKASVTVAMTPPKVVVHDLEALRSYAEYWKPYKYDEGNVNKAELKMDLAAGTIVDPRIATLEHGTTLRIK